MTSGPDWRPIPVMPEWARARRLTFAWFGLAAMLLLCPCVYTLGLHLQSQHDLCVQTLEATPD